MMFLLLLMMMIDPLIFKVKKTYSLVFFITLIFISLDLYLRGDSEYSIPIYKTYVYILFLGLFFSKGYKIIFGDLNIIVLILAIESLWLTSNLVQFILVGIDSYELTFLQVNSQNSYSCSSSENSELSINNPQFLNKNKNKKLSLFSNQIEKKLKFNENGIIFKQNLINEDSNRTPEQNLNILFSQLTIT